uniref:Uncharacterized protein n=1 Tax=Oryza meridionalis TaxID=40149 RepID=A0A0E0E718_9ORYZ
MLVAGDGVPDHEFHGIEEVGEDPAVAAVERPPPVGGIDGRWGEWRRGGSGDEAGDGGDRLVAVNVVEEAEHGRCSVECAVAAEEGGVGEDATPGLADEGGVDEVRGFIRRDAEEDLGGDVVDQLRRRRHAGGRGSLAVAGARVWVGEEEVDSDSRLLGDLLRRGIGDVDLDDAEPEQQLLGLHAGDLLQLPLLDERRDLAGEALGEAELLQQLDGLLPADAVSTDDLRAGTVALNL